MTKESWLEKLIELLNEYEKWKGENGLDIRQQYAAHNFKYNKRLYSIIISRKYWFIQRLVENDKINRKKIEKNQTYQLCLGLLIDMGYYVNVLLMLLSISDEPIRFLISVLK